MFSASTTALATATLKQKRTFLSRNPSRDSKRLSILHADIATTAPASNLMTPSVSPSKSELAVPAKSAYTVKRAGVADTPALARCFLAAFTEGSTDSDRFFTFLLRPNPRIEALLRDTYAEALQQEFPSIMYKVVGPGGDEDVVAMAKINQPRTPLKGLDLSQDVGVDAQYLTTFLEKMGEAHHRIMGDKPHWYVEQIGVRLAHQGKRIGSMLMDEICATIDKEGSEAYIEGSPAGVGLYQKYGFRPLEFLRAPPPCENLYKNCLMVRPGKR